MSALDYLDDDLIASLANWLPLHCDKCGGEVPLNNSVLAVEEVYFHDSLFCRDRHFMPVAGCEGSPSRIRKLETDAEYRAVYEFIRDLKPGGEDESSG